MSKDKIADYDGTTAGNNTDIGGISIAEGMLPSAVNNSMRELTKQLGAFANGTDAIDALDVTGAATVGGAFTSPGIDDNANATAITIDASENVLVGKTATNYQSVGIEAKGNGSLWGTADGNNPLILVRKSSDGAIAQFYKDTTSVGSIAVSSSDNLQLLGSATDHAGFEFGTNLIIPKSNGANADGAIDLGLSSVRWKDIYLSGGAYLGGTGSANHLQDYETGTFTAVLDNVSVGYGTRTGRYTKIGNTVFVHLEITTTSLDGTDGSAYQIGGLPFTADGGGVLFSYDSENSTGLTQKSTLLGARMNNGLASVRLSRDGSDYQYNTGTQSAGSIVCTLQYFTTQ